MEVGAGLKKVCGETMTQGVWMDGFFEVRALGGSVTGMPNRFRVDGVVSSMPTVTGEEPVAGFSPEPMPVFAQFLE